MLKSNVMFVFGELFYFLPDGPQLYYIYFFIIENLSKMGFWFYLRCHIIRNIPNGTVSCWTLLWKQTPNSCLVLGCYVVLWKCWCLVLSSSWHWCVTRDFYADIEVDSKVNERQRHIQRERYKERVRKEATNLKSERYWNHWALV